MMLLLLFNDDVIKIDVVVDILNDSIEVAIL